MDENKKTGASPDWTAPESEEYTNDSTLFACGVSSAELHPDRGVYLPLTLRTRADEHAHRRTVFVIDAGLAALLLLALTTVVLLVGVLQ